MFFYSSPNGGRVYFDEMGPPWPKHPCTDSTFTEGAGDHHPRAERRSEPTWVREGWRALRVGSQTRGIRELGRNVSDWSVLEAWDLRKGPLTVLLEEPPEISRDSVAFLSEWSDDGRASLSWLSGNNGQFEARVVPARRPEFFRELTVDEARTFADLPSGERELNALEHVFRKYASPSLSPLGIGLCALSLDMAIQDARATGWQLDRTESDRMQSAVRIWASTRKWNAERTCIEAIRFLRAFY